MSKGVQLYAWSLGFLGALALAWSLPGLTSAHLLPMLGWGICAVLFQRYPITLPNRLNFSFGSTFILMAFLDQGISAGLVVVAAAALVTALNAKRLVQKVFNFGQLILSLVAAAWVTGKVGGGQDLLTPYGWIGALAGALAYYTVNTIMVAVVVRLASRRPFREFLPDMLRESYMGSLSGILLLIPFFVAFRNVGWLSLVMVSAGLLAFRYAVQLYLEQRRLHLQTLEQFGTLVERQIGKAENHAIQVARLAKQVAEDLKLRPNDVESIYAAALLHDVGEAEIDPRVISVMVRRAIPTLQDLEVYRQHPVLGEQTVGRVGGMGEVARLVRWHHEAWDGSGYPDGMAGVAIPLGARILSAAEALVGAGSTAEEWQAALPRLAGRVIDPGLLPSLERVLRAEARAHRSTLDTLAEARASDLQRQLLQELHSSQLMEAVGAGRFLSYQDGVFFNFLAMPVTPPAPEAMAQVAKHCLATHLPVRERLVDQGQVYDVYGLPTGEGSVRILLFDLTQALAVEREQTRQIFQAYRDVLAAATQGKLILLDAEAWSVEAVSGEPLWELDLAQVGEGAEARRLTEETAARFGLASAERYRLKVCIAEAVTNVFKHAGSGRISARLLPGRLRFIIQDHGDGIPYDILPQALLMEGYSTKRSMGKGFSVILRYGDRLLLRTSKAGTTLMIDRQLDPASVMEERGNSSAADSLGGHGVRAAAAAGG